MKTCSKCKETKPLDAFYKHAGRKDGGQTYCKLCVTASQKAYRTKNPDKIKVHNKAYSTKNADKRKAYLTKNTDKTKVYMKTYQQSPKGKAVRNAIQAKRKAAKLPRTPIWCDLEAIKQVYATCPEGYHVDHIIPLQGELVSGLHIASNLQHMTAKDNSEKHNRYDVDRYEYRRPSYE